MTAIKFTKALADCCLPIGVLSIRKGKNIHISVSLSTFNFYLITLISIL